MDVVGAFVGVDDFEVDEVAGDAVFIGDAVAAEHVAGGASDVQALAAAVALHDGGDLDRCRAFVLHAAQAQAALQAQCDFSLHVGQLFLDQLIGLGALGDELRDLTDSVHRDEVARTQQRLRIETLQTKAVAPKALDGCLAYRNPRSRQRLPAQLERIP